MNNTSYDTIDAIARPGIPATGSPSGGRHHSAGSRLDAVVEARLSEKFGLTSPLLTRSASEGFLCALLALGVAQGDEVILPVSICHTMVNAVLLAGATPVLADCDHDLALSAEGLDHRLTGRTRCVVVHHPFGLACDLAPIRARLARHGNGVVLVEDCAQALGASFGNPVGSQGEVALFSFGPRKPLPAGVGGLVTARGAALRRGLRLAARAGAPGYPDNEVLGVNSSVGDADAARLLESIDLFDAETAQRIADARTALDMFAGSIPVVGTDRRGGNPFRNIFHRIIVDLPTVNRKEHYNAFVDRARRMLEPEIAALCQTAVPKAPYESSYLDERYRRLGRADLCDPAGTAFPVWRGVRWRYLYLRAGAGPVVTTLICNALLRVTGQQPYGGI